MTQDEKLDKVLKLLVMALDPLEDVVNELRASHRSRWIMLLAMVAIVVGSGLSMVHLLDRIGDLTDRIVDAQATMLVYNARLNRLIDLAEENASTPEIRRELKVLQRMDKPTPRNVIRAAAQIAPDVILEEAARLLPPSPGTDSGTDP